MRTGIKQPGQLKTWSLPEVDNWVFADLHKAGTRYQGNRNAVVPIVAKQSPSTGQNLPIQPDPASAEWFLAGMWYPVALKIKILRI